MMNSGGGGDLQDKDTEPVSDLASAASIPTLLPDDDRVPPEGTMYKYRDFSNINDEEEDVEIPPPSAGTRGNMESSIRVQKFPVKLYAILAQKEFHDIITWMPHGRAWKVLKPSMFESMVMPLFFEYSNYHSFNRLVNAWSFRRVSSGPDRGSYYHELFLRGKPHLQKYMRRLPKTHKKLPMKKEDEPDFYSLDKTNPLPALEDAPIPGAAATTMAMHSQAQAQARNPHNMMNGHHHQGHAAAMMNSHAMEMMAGQHHRNGFHQQQQQQQHQQHQQAVHIFNHPDAVVSQTPEDYDVGQPMNFQDQQHYQRSNGNNAMRDNGSNNSRVSPTHLAPGVSATSSYLLAQMSQERGEGGMRQPQPYHPGAGNNNHGAMEPLNPDLFSDQPLNPHHSVQQQQHQQQGSVTMDNSGGQHQQQQQQQQPDELFHYQQQMKLQRMNQQQNQQMQAAAGMPNGMFAQERSGTASGNGNGNNKMGTHLMPEDFRPRAQRPQC